MADIVPPCGVKVPKAFLRSSIFHFSFLVSMYFRDRKYQIFLSNVLFSVEKYQKTFRVFHASFCYLLTVRFPKWQKLLPAVVKQFVILNGNLHWQIIKIRIRKRKRNNHLMIYSTYGGSGVKHCLSGDDKQYNNKRSEYLTSAPCEVKRSLEIPLGYWFTLETFDTFGYKSM